MNRQSYNTKNYVVRNRKGFRMVASMFLALTMGMAGFSCTDDLGVNPDDKKTPEVIPAGTKLYSYIRVLPVDGIPSRADDNYGENDYPADFVPGNKEYESRIINMLIIFYDKDDKVLTYKELDESYLEKLKFDKELRENLAINETDGVIEQFGYDVLIPIEEEVAENLLVDDAENFIGSYFVILNYNEDLLRDLKAVIETTSQKTGMAKDVIITQTVNSHQLDKDSKSKLGFLMTTAGHFNLSNNYFWYDVAPEGNKVLYRTATEARANAITIYVERLAARVDFEVKKNIDKIEVFYNESDVYELIFTPIDWTLEATEKNSFLPKQMDKNSNTEVYATNVYPSDFYEWIQYNHNRVFWAKSKEFQPSGKYPSKGDELKNGEQLILKYVKFVDFIDTEYNISKNLDENWKGRLYDLEHTFYSEIATYSESELNKAVNPYAVPTSVVLGGRYTTATLATPGTDEKDEKGDEDETHKPTVKSLDLTDGFYIRFVDMERTDLGSDPQKTYQYHLYLEGRNASPGKEARTDELLEAMLKEQYMIWEAVKDTEGEITSYKVVRNNKNDIFTITNTQTRYMGNPTIDEDKWIDASNTYTLQLTGNGSDLFYKTSATDTYHAIEDDTSLAAANKALQKQLGYAQRYWQGYAFFYAPIPHYSGDYDPFDKNKTGRSYNGLFNYKATDGVYDRNATTGNYIVNHYTGDFGFVRNHIYNITINKIGNLGYGIPDKEFIPLPEPRIDHKLYQFDLELKILPWNIFEYTFDI